MIGTGDRARTCRTDTPFISVVIPCYNYARYLPEAVESILAQTYPHHEIIIVNDGSPDDTQEVAQALIRKHSPHRISLINKPNGGVADARNAGIAAAIGSWILPLDADDHFHPTFLEKAVEAISHDPLINLVFTNVQSFGGSTDQWVPLDFELSTQRICNSLPYCSLYRKELWVRIGGYERAIPWGNEDFAFWIAAGKLGLRTFRVPGALFNYRKHDAIGLMSGLMPRFQTVEAMLFTMNPELYPEANILAAHQRIGKMDPETLALLDRKDARFGDLAYTYLWRGLKFEADNDFEQAMHQYDQFQRRFFRPDWQPLWGMLVCNLSLGRWDAARSALATIRQLFPNVSFIEEMLPKVQLPETAWGVS